MRARAIFITLTITSVIAVVGCQSRESQAPAQSPASAATASQIKARVTPGKRVIFIGLDGADWSLLDGYAARGVMPTLARLVSEGTSGTLETIHPPLSP
jgi:hypothetical protein